MSSWFDDMNDRELLDLIPFLEKLSQVESVYGLLAAKFKSNNGSSATESQVIPNNSSGQSSLTKNSWIFQIIEQFLL